MRVLLGVGPAQSLIKVRRGALGLVSTAEDAEGASHKRIPGFLQDPRPAPTLVATTSSIASPNEKTDTFGSSPVNFHTKSSILDLRVTLAGTPVRVNQG